MDHLVRDLTFLLCNFTAGESERHFIECLQQRWLAWFSLLQGISGWIELTEWIALLAGLLLLMAMMIVLGIIINTRSDLEKKVRSRTAELQESEMMSRLLMNSLSVGVVIVDPATHVIEMANASAANLIGASEDRIIGRICHQFMCPSHEGACPVTDLHQDIDNSDCTLLCADGSSIPILKSVKCVNIGGHEKLLEIFTDMSRHKKAEEELRVSRERLDQLAEHSGEVIWEFDTQGLITYASRASKSLFGFDDDEIVGKYHFYDFHPEEGREDYRRRAFLLLKHMLPFRNINTRIVGRNGQVFDVLASGVPMFNSDGTLKGYRGSNRDITELRRTEEGLRESEELFRTISMSAHDAIIKLDNEGNISYWNRAAEEIFQYREDEAVGRNLHTLLAPAKFHSAHFKAFRVFRKTGQGAAIGKTLELAAIRKNGEEFPIELSLSAVQVRGRWEGIGILRDITERKKVEEELRRSNLLLEEAVAKAHQLALQADMANKAKSEFLANMSHEIRTPMNGILGMTELLLNTSLGDDQRRYTEIVRSSGETLLDLINDILDFSKIEAGRLELEIIDFDLQSMLDNLCSTLAIKAQEKGLEFICAEGPEVPAILQGDPGRLRQILTNLVGNAIKFTRSGEVTIRVTVEEETDDEALLRFSVHDTGIGIPREKFAILFDKFSQVDASTTRQYGGTGLGLAISKQLSTLMGGEIGVNSEKGKGSEFWFTARLKKSCTGENLRAPLLSSMQGVHVLIVDDNATNREVLRIQVASWGMIPSEAADGPTALQMLYQAIDTDRVYRLALIDMQMPDMDGEELGRTIRSDRRLDATGLVLMTSMGKRGDAQRVENAGFSAYLSKPVRPSELRACLATVLMHRKEPIELQPIVTRHSLRDIYRHYTQDQEKKASILIVEDNIINQKVAQEIITRFGLKSDIVSNGAEAVKALASVPYDLVLMDIQMPVMDGIEASRAIRSPDSGVMNSQIPIIAMTAYALEGDREKCLEAGMNDYLSKPVNPQAMAKALERWLPHHGLPVEELIMETKTENGNSDSSSCGRKKVSVYDREAMLIRTMGDEIVAHKILEAFIAEFPGMIDTLITSVSKGDTVSAERMAHTIQGSAASVSCDTIHEIALKMQKAGREGLLSEIEAMIPDLKEQLEKVKKIVKEDNQ